MNFEAADSMRQATCIVLPLPVVDKYFGADPQTRPFEHQTAKAMCRRCVGRIACLSDAIGSPGAFQGSAELVRGGEAGVVIRHLRRRHFLGGEPVAKLVRQTIEQQASARDAGGFPYLRQGKFRDAVLAEDWDDAVEGDDASN